MNDAEVANFLRGAQPIVMFDTNAIIGNHPRTDPFIALCRDVLNLNTTRPHGGPPITLALSSVVLSEKLQDLRQWFGPRFHPALVDTFVTTYEIRVLEFDRRCSERTADRIAALYPGETEWYAFKRRRCLECLGLPREHEAPGKGGGCGATVDWLIAGHAEHLGALLVTHDRGPEFQSITRRTTLDCLRRVVQALLSSAPSGPA